MRRSPALLVLIGSSIWSASTAPTTNPDMSKLDSLKTPGISEVSPPIRAQPTFLHASEIPPTIVSTTLGIIWDVAM